MSLFAGASRRVIVSAPGLDLAGYSARPNPSRGVHDEIHARALALAAGNRLIVIVTVDLLGLTIAHSNRLRRAIAQRVGCGAGQGGGRSIDIVLAATHSHSAPASMSLRKCGEVDAAWLRGSGETIIAAACEAVQALQPARLGAGSGAVAGLTVNRRLELHAAGTLAARMAEGATYPTDETVGVLRVDNRAGRPLASLINFACHPVALRHDNLLISADYPGEIARRIEAETGGVALVCNGAGGDINPIARGSWEAVEALAAPVAMEALNVQAAIGARAAVHLDAERESFDIRLLPLPSRAELRRLSRQFAAELREARNAGSAVAADIAEAYRDWSRELQQRSGTTAPRRRIEVQVLRLGAAALAAIPGEVFAQLGLDVKATLRDAGAQEAFVSGYTNGNLGYLPTRAAYRDGGYEVETAHRFYRQPTCVAPEAGESIVESVGRQGRRLFK